MVSETNTILKALDGRLKSVFNDAYQTAVANNERAVAKLANFDESKFPNATAEELRRARQNYALQVERTSGIIDNISREIANSGRTASQIIDGTRLDVFSSEYKGSLTAIDQQLGFNVNWSIYDRNKLRVLMEDTTRTVRHEALVFENGKLVKREIEMSAQPFGMVGAREVYDRRQAQYIRERAYGRLGNNTIIRQRLQNQLTQAVLNGEGIQKIATRIKGVTEMSRRQAVTIARTEMARVQNQARMMGFYQARDEYGIDMLKEWVHSGHGTKDPRPHHVAINGEQQELDQPFSIGLMFPLDPSAGPEDVIHCGCTMVPVLKKFAPDANLAKSGERGIINAMEDTIHGPIEFGRPADVVFAGKELSERQQGLLDSLPGYGSKAVFSKNTVSMPDLAAMTAKTGDEFAMFTRNNERLIIRGDSDQVPLYKSGASKLNEEGYRWSGHTHPGFDAGSLIVSDGDRKILDQFNQNQSVVYNAAGKYVRFGKDW